MRKSALKEKAAAAFFGNIRELTVLSAMFFIGLIIGAIVSVKLDDSQAASVSEYMDCFFSAFALEGVDKNSVCRASIAGNIKCIIMMCLPVLSFWLIPFLAAQIALKGFKIGFSIAYLASAYGAAGMTVGFFSLFWQILFTMPVLLLCGAQIMSFSLKLRGGGKGISRFKNIRGKVYINLIAALLLSVLTVVLGGLFDGYAATVITLSLCGILEI